jgi:phage terminase large subunit
MLDLPAILNLPPKLLPVITEFDKYRYFLLEGGRGSAKSQSVGRFLLYLNEHYKLRTVCGREVQTNIDESVHALLKDLITKNTLSYRVLEKEIRHLVSGSEIGFRGFRDVGGKTNVRGMEGVDILWIDEAQQVSQRTVADVIPTVRKDNAKVIFSMNRFMRNDPAYEFCVGRKDCLHIHIDYFDNPFCPLSIKHEAEVLKNKNMKEYRHIYLGEPLAQADDYLFNIEKLHASFDITPFGETFGRQRVMGIDFAAQGNDMCVATILDRVTNVHWRLTERISWGEPDTTVSVGKIINLIGQYKPDIVTLDVGGSGHNVHCDLTAAGLVVHRFDGGSTQNVDVAHYVNQRAEGYYTAKEWFDHGWLIIDRKDIEVINELEKIKMKWRSDGRRIIEEKVKMKKEIGHSPDNADSLMMAVYGAVKYLGKSSNSRASTATEIKRKSGSNRRKA